MNTTEILTGIKNWVVGKLVLKQDVINDLTTIRSGAAAGATAVQPSDLSAYFNDAAYDGNSKRINFYHGQTIVAYIDATAFVIDGMVEDVRIENGYLIIDFNTASGKQDISIPLTDIFDPSNYYTKTQTDTLLAEKEAVANKVTTIDGDSTDTEYPSAKAVFDSVALAVEELEDNVVMTGSYDATVAVGLADNLRGDTIVDAEFYKRKTGGTQSVGSGIAAIKEVRGKSIVWNQVLVPLAAGTTIQRGITIVSDGNGTVSFSGTASSSGSVPLTELFSAVEGHKYALIISRNSGNIAITQVYWGRFNAFSIKVSTIIVGASNGTEKLGMAVTNDSVYEGEIKMFLADLTLMFGAGNEPATVAEFEKMFPLDYYDYNEGEIIPFAGQNLVTTGFNQWDEQWEVGSIDSTTGENAVGNYYTRSKNHIPIISWENYYFKKPSNVLTYLFFYDSDKNFIIRTDPFATTGQGGTFVIPNGSRYMRFATYRTTYKNDICINISNTEKNGIYEPYEKHTLPLDPSQWRDTNNELVFPYGGMHGVGTVYDYAKVDADGYIRKVVRCFEQVDLGTLLYGYEVSGRFYTTGISNLIQKIEGNLNIVSPLFIPTNNLSVVYANSNRMWESNVGNVSFSTNGYTDATSFKSAMQGVMLYYPLAEPVEVELATPVYAKYLVDKDGTEEITPANGTKPYTTMANISVLYAMDARGEIKNLPKNYLSKESAENMLNAMVSAGVIASYTMTYDAANARYQFTIVAPAQSNN